MYRKSSGIVYLLQHGIDYEHVHESGEISPHRRQRAAIMTNFNDVTSIALEKFPLMLKRYRKIMTKNKADENPARR